MKNVYLLVTDLHYAETKANRVNYLSEILEAIQSILDIAYKYRKVGYKVILIFLGDVIDSSMSNSEEAMRCVDLLRYFICEFDDAYSVVGNHEQTYTASNPFWYLVTEIQDEELAKIPRALQPRSINTCLKIPSVIKDGEVAIYFNHYGIPVKVPTKDGVAIGVFHQNIGSNSICQMWGTFDDVEEAAYIQAYNYCFFGHMHMAYGKFFLNDQHTCVGEWLGSCGRANVLEVENAPLDVNIPAILVEDGKFIKVEENLVTRRDAKSCIDYPKLNIMRDATKQLESIKNAVPHTTLSGSLLGNVQEAAELAGLGAVLSMLSGSYDNLLRQYKVGLRQMLDATPDFKAAGDESFEHNESEGT